jgi:replicative DNA helicase
MQPRRPQRDADMVRLMRRPDPFDREDPRGGEADIILGKHRSGPTAEVSVTGGRPSVLQKTGTG